MLPPEGTTPPGTPHYDSEETVFIQDWFHAQGPVLAFHLQRCLAMSSSSSLSVRQRMLDRGPCAETKCDSVLLPRRPFDPALATNKTGAWEWVGAYDARLLLA